MGIQVGKRPIPPPWPAGFPVPLTGDSGGTHFDDGKLGGDVETVQQDKVRSRNRLKEVIRDFARPGKLIRVKVDTQGAVGDQSTGR